MHSTLAACAQSAVTTLHVLRAELALPLDAARRNRLDTLIAIAADDLAELLPVGSKLHTPAGYRTQAPDHERRARLAVSAPIEGGDNVVQFPRL